MNREAAISVEELAPKRRFRTYLDCRESKIEWLGSLPTHWDVCRTKHIAALKSGHTPSRQNAEYWNDCSIPWFTLADVWQLRHRGQKYLGDTAEKISELGLKHSAADLLPEGTVILSRTASVGFTGIMPHAMATSQDFVNWVCGPRLLPDYLWYVFQAMRPEFDRLIQGSTHKTVYMPDARAFNTPVPSREEQRAIAAFLDRETARIDELIAKKQRLIELLAEKRTALISHAVTKGLNPDAPMKDSRIEWLGQVPEHWSVKRLKFLADGGLENGLFKKKQFFGSGVRLVNVFDVYREDFAVDESTLERVEADRVETRRYAVQPGDIFFVRSSLKLEGVGKSACMFELSEPTVFECHLVRMRPSLNAILPHFLINFLNSIPATNRLIALANQVTMTTIAQDKFKSLEVPVPPLQEQEAIIELLSEHTSTFFALNLSVTEAIDKLREYRSALISAAVTGKIDMREEVRK